MVEKQMQIRNKTGLHARPASQLIQIAKKFRCEITLEKGTEQANCKSIISLLSCNVTQGAAVVVRANGEDEQQALSAVADFIDSLEE